MVINIINIYKAGTVGWSCKAIGASVASVGADRKTIHVYTTAIFHRRQTSKAVNETIIKDVTRRSFIVKSFSPLSIKLYIVDRPFKVGAIPATLVKSSTSSVPLETPFYFEYQNARYTRCRHGNAICMRLAHYAVYAAID